LLPVREAVPVATIHDCIFTLDGDGRAPLDERPGYMETAVAELRQLLDGRSGPAA